MQRPKKTACSNVAPLATGGAVALAALLTAGAARAQNKPFPQNGGYTHGFMPSNVTASDVLASYANWKGRYLKSDCGGGTYRVEFLNPKGSTVSEGMGYGMLLSAYLGDKPVFDGLWKFVQKNLNPNGLMGWKETCSGFITGEGGGGSATDGDTDIGLALVAAVDQWGDAYRATATSYLATLKKVDYITCAPSGRNLAKEGDWGGGCDHGNTSYWMPAFFRVFQEFSGDAFWGKAASDAIDLWRVNRNPRTGLIANEVDQNGATANQQSYVDYNGCRIPWRAVVDYLWYGTSGAKDITDKMTDWAGSVGIGKLVDGYNVDGSPTQYGKNTQLNAWVGAWACGAMSKGQDVVNAFAADFKKIPDDNGTYYGSSLRTLYLLTLSGNFWKPGTAPTSTGHGGAAPATIPSGKSASCGCSRATASLPLGTASGAVAGIAALTVRRRRRRR